jgi:phage terminase large subunit-like protein
MHWKEFFKRDLIASELKLILILDVRQQILDNLPGRLSRWIRTWDMAL